MYIDVSTSVGNLDETFVHFDLFWNFQLVNVKIIPYGSEGKGGGGGGGGGEFATG